MFNNDDSIQTRCLSDILSSYPGELHAILLNEIPDLVSEEDADSTDQILKRVWGNQKLAEKYLDILDNYENKGRTHIFFYHLQDKEYLGRLRDEKKLKEILPVEERGLVNEKVFLWDSPGPKLVNIRHHFHNDRGELAFKWVESRLWDERVAGGTTASPPRYVRRKERAVNYFIVDLNEGIAQLRIQLIKPNALQPLKSAYEIYLEEIEKLIDFKKFKRIDLESVVKKFLSDREIEPKSWEIWLPGGGCFTAKGKPALYLKLGLGMSKLRLIDFFGRIICCEYRSKNHSWGPANVKLKLDGEKDIFTIYSPCEQQQMTLIIDKVISIKKNKIGDRNLNKFQKNNPRMGRIALSFDYHFRRFKREEVTTGHLMANEWLQKNKVVDAIKLLCGDFPKNYDNKGSGKNFTLLKKP